MTPTLAIPTVEPDPVPAEEPPMTVDEAGAILDAVVEVFLARAARERVR